MMVEKPGAGIVNILLVWAIGLALGVAAGAATAMLLTPMHGKAAPQDETAEEFSEPDSSNIVTLPEKEPT